MDPEAARDSYEASALSIDDVVHVRLGVRPRAGGTPLNSASCLPCRLTQPGTRKPRRRSQYPPPKPHQSGRRQPSAQALPALVDLAGQSPRRALASCSTRRSRSGLVVALLDHDPCEPGHGGTARAAPRRRRAGCLLTVTPLVGPLLPASGHRRPSARSRPSGGGGTVTDAQRQTWGAAQQRGRDARKTAGPVLSVRHSGGPRCAVRRRHGVGQTVMYAHGQMALAELRPAGTLKRPKGPSRNSGREWGASSAEHRQVASEWQGRQTGSPARARRGLGPIADAAGPGLDSLRPTAEGALWGRLRSAAGALSRRRPKKLQERVPPGLGGTRSSLRDFNRDSCGRVGGMMLVQLPRDVLGVGLDTKGPSQDPGRGTLKTPGGEGRGGPRRQSFKLRRATTFCFVFSP